MLDNAVYFYDASLPTVTPLRSESSRTEFEGEARHRGSLIDLHYISPDKFTIISSKHNTKLSLDDSRLSIKASESSENSMREIALMQKLSMVGKGQSLVVGPTLMLSGDHKPPLSKGSVGKRNSLVFKGDKKAR